MNSDRHVTEVEAEARAYIEEKYEIDLALLDELIGEISLGCSVVSGNDHDRGVGFLHLVSFNRAINALRRAREDIATGYSAQALTMTRSAYEDYGVICYTDRHPEIVDTWLQHLLPGIEETNTPPPKRSEIWNDLKPTMGDEIGALYGMLCGFSHPDVIGFAWLISYKEGTWQFTVGPQTDELQVLSALHHTILVASVLAWRVADLQERLLGERDNDWWRRIAPLLMGTAPKVADKNRARLVELLGYDPAVVAASSAADE